MTQIPSTTQSKYATLLLQLRYSRLSAIPMILMIILIYISSSRPVPSAATSIPDWLLHGTAYFILCLLTWIAVSGPFRRLLPRNAILTSFVITTLVGVFDEWHQSFVSFRDASIKDGVADAVGALLAIILLNVIYQKGFNTFTHENDNTSD